MRTTDKWTLDNIYTIARRELARTADSKQQARNWKRRNRTIAFNGESLTLGEWAERIGIARESLRDRFDGGWSIERALTTPPVRVRRRDQRGIFKASCD